MGTTMTKLINSSLNQGKINSIEAKTQSNRKPANWSRIEIPIPSIESYSEP